MRTVCERMAVAILSVLLCLAALEISLRFGAGAYLRLRAGHAAVPAEGGGGPTVLCFGDSFTYGLGAPAGCDYPAELSRLLAGSGRTHARVLNRGFLGANTTVLLRRLPMILERDRPDVVVILAGLSNGWNADGLYGFMAGEGGGILPAAADFFFRLGTVKLFRLLYGQLSPDAAPQTAGREAYVLGLRDEAALLDEIERNPDCHVAYRALSRIYLETEGPERACRFLEESLRGTPDLPQLYEYLSDLYLELGRERESVRVLLSGMRVHPRDRRFYNLSIGIFKHIREDGARQMISDGFASLAAQGYGLGREFSAIFESGTVGIAPLVGRWILADLGLMVELCRQRGCAVVLQNYPCQGEYDALFRDFARARGLHFVDQFAAFARPGLDTQGLFVADGHCSAAGYALMAQNVAQVLGREGLAGGIKSGRDGR